MRASWATLWKQSTVSHIHLLCGTNNSCSHSLATIPSSLTEILFLLRRKWRLHMSSYFQFYHDSINFKHTLLLLTFIFIFRFKNCFQNLFFYHELPSTLYNQNLYRADKLHLTTKGNDILVRWLHYCITRLTQPTQNQTHPLPSLQDLPSPLVITDTDWPPLPTCPITTLQTNYIVSIQIQQTKPN